MASNLRPLTARGNSAPTPARNSATPQQLGPLGTLSRLPTDVLVDHILPRTIHNKSFPGFAYSCRAALELSSQLATSINTAYFARKQYAERNSSLRIGPGGAPLVPAFSASQESAARKFALFLRRNNPQEMALDHAAHGRWPEAEAAWRRAIGRWPNHEANHRGLAAALVEQGNYVAAEASYVQALTLAPNDRASLCGLGKVLYSVGRFAEAAESCERALVQWSGDMQSHRVAAMAYLAQEMGPEAEGHLNLLLHVRPRDQELRLQLGKALALQEKLALAVEAFRTLLTFNPLHSQAHLHLGNALYRLGKMMESRVSLERAVVLRPTDAHTHGALARTYMALGDLDAAEFVSSQACKLAPTASWLWRLSHEVTEKKYFSLGPSYLLDLARRCDDFAARPTDPATVRALGVGLYEAGLSRAARPLLQRAVASFPRDGQAHYALGGALFRLGHVDEGLVSLRLAVGLRPLLLDDLQEWGEDLLVDGVNELAMRCFSLVLESRENDVAASCGLGVALLGEQQFAEAEQIFRSAVQTDGANVKALFGLAVTLGLLQRHQEKGAVLADLLQLEPSHVDAHREYGTVLGLLGRPSDAEYHLLEALTLSDDEDNLPAVYDALGRLYMAQSRYRDARAAFHSLLALFPNFPGARAALSAAEDAAAEAAETDA